MKQFDSLIFFNFHLVFFSITWKQFIVWMLNIAMCLVCLVKLLVHGEPIVHQSEMDEYYVCKKKADQLMSEVCGKCDKVLSIIS